MEWSCPSHALVKKNLKKIHAHQPNGQTVSLEPKAPTEGATPHWSGDAEAASELTNKVRKSDEVFSRNTRPAARLSLRKPQPKFPSKTLFAAGGVGRGEEEGEGPTTEFRTDCFNFCLSRGRWNGNKS